MTKANETLGRFVNTRILTGCRYDRALAAARDALKGKRGADIGIEITRPEGLRRLSDASQVSSLRTVNVMSPDVICIRALAGTDDSGPLVVEVSAGEFMGDAIFGVTVYHVLPGARERDWDKSQCLHDVDSLVAYVRALNGAD